MSLPERDWEYTELSEKMGITTEAFFKVLASSGLSDEEILVRESIQNCRDAGAKDSKIMVTFTGKSLDATAVDHLSKALLFDELVKDRGEHIVKSEVFQRKLSREEPLRMLEVADYGTCGLGGDWRGYEEEDHFARLVMRIGESDKDDGGPKGGSYGFGKTVFAKRSSAHLAIYYSVIEEGSCPEGHRARFMAVWLLKKHKHEGTQYSGYSFLGKHHGEGASVAPLINEEAHAMAQACGLKVRADSNPGTTVAIVSCHLDMAHIKDAIERYWWPGISDDKIAVKVYDDGESLGVAPKKNPQVAPYMALGKALRTGDPRTTWSDASEDKDIKLRRFRAFGSFQLGNIAMKALTEEEVEACKAHIDSVYPDNGENANYGGIALVRGTGMVVNYQGATNPEGAVTAGLFEADSEVDSILRISEPPAHHVWDEHESRLSEAFPEEGKKVVGSLNKRLQDSILDFRRKLPPPPPPSEYRLNQLESLLSKFVQSGHENEPVPPPAQRPVTISVDTPARTKTPDKLTDITTISIGIRDDLDIEELDCKVRVDYHLLGDTSSHVIGFSDCSVEDEDGNQLAREHGQEFQLKLSSSQRKKLIASAQAIPDSKAEFKVRVTKS